MPRTGRRGRALLAGVLLGIGCLAAALQFGPALLASVAQTRPPPRTLACPALPARETMPREALPEWLESADWRARNERLDGELAGLNRGQVRLVFVGDSITQYFDPGLFQQFYGQRAPLNLGLWGDFTQGALWRLFAGPSGGQWGSLAPQLAVVLLGTNNTQWGSSPEDVALGLAELLRQIQARAPRTKILLLGLLPRGADGTEPLRAVNAAVNALVARCADERFVFYADIGRYLLDAQGRLSEQVSFDRLHLTAIGYAILATALEPTIRRLLQD